MAVSPSTLEQQVNIEKRYNCVVCLCARFQMVYGRCQHRICTQCAYGSRGGLREQFHRCPSCQHENSFPERKPTIPEDNIELQRLLGVVVCLNDRCNQEFWSWERSEHELTCPYKHSQRKEKHCSNNGNNHSTATPKSKRTRQSRSSTKRDYKLRARHNSTFTDRKVQIV